MLSEPNVERLASTLCRLRGAALKVGQMLSFNNAEVLPPALRTVMDRVRDGADVMPAWQLEQTMSQVPCPSESPPAHVEPHFFTSCLCS
jgi:aarF domain-containing kinase